MVNTGEKPKCVHCRRWSQCRPRGLCWTCSLDPAVRVLYPARGRMGEAGARNRAADFAPLAPAARPTSYRPGSVGKLLTLMDRYANRRELWHPDDARS